MIVTRLSRQYILNRIFGRKHDGNLRLIPRFKLINKKMITRGY